MRLILILIAVIFLSMPGLYRLRACEEGPEVIEVQVEISEEGSAYDGGYEVGSGVTEPERETNYD